MQIQQMRLLKPLHLVRPKRICELRNYMSAHGVYISDYKYMEDIPINDSEVIVAVIDDHISSSYEGLEEQFWVNEGWSWNETAGVDDDGIGYIDDIHGWDFDGDQPVGY